MFALLASMTVLLSAAPALAGTPVDQRTPAAKQDSKRIICEKVEQIGSRLASKRICMTADQWAEKRRLDREHLETHQRAPEPGR